MKNLKRLLSLALAGTILSGMMVMGASAATFGDADEIVNTEAVDTMVALNIINGKPDGNYDPNGLVTRAEMAKMIATAVNGGVAPEFGTKPTPTYSDIKGNWAEQFIEYCADMKYISGRGNGTFDPAGNVTGVEAAKMVLTALGYNEDAYQLKGADWAINTNAIAVRTCKPSLYENLNGVNMNVAIDRDTAAQIIWNGVQNHIVEWTPNREVTGTGLNYEYTINPNVTLLNKAYDAYIWIGTFKGNDKFAGLGLTKGEIQVDGGLEDVDYTDDRSYPYSAKFPAEFDIANIGEETKVIFKDGKTGRKGQPTRDDTIYGVFNTGASEVVTGTMADVKNQKSDKAQINIAGTKYETADSVTVITNYVGNGTSYDATNGNSSTNSALTNALKAVNGNTIKAIVDPISNEIETIYVTTSKIAVVLSKNAEKVTLNNNVGSIKIADNEVYEDIKKDDVVVITTLYDTDATKETAYSIVKKAEVVSGEVDGFKVDSDSHKINVTVDGTVYKIENEITGDLFKSGLGNDAKGEFSGLIGETVDLYLVNGYVVAAVQTSESASNWSVVLEAKSGASTGSVFDGLQLQVMDAEGTKHIITVSKDTDVADVPDVNGNSKMDDVDIPCGSLITYTTNKDNEAVIKDFVPYGTWNSSATPNPKWDAPTDTDGYDKNTKTFGDVTTTTDCVLFVNTADGKAIGVEGFTMKAYKIRDLDNVNVGGSKVTINASKDSKVVAAVMDLQGSPNGATSTRVYGIVSASNGTVKVDGDEKSSYTVDVNDAQYTVYLPSAGLATGDIVTFEPANDNIYVGVGSSDNEITKVANGGTTIVGWAKEHNETDDTVTIFTSLTAKDSSGNTTTTPSAVASYEGNANETVAVDDDTKFYYVDQNNDKGVEIASIVEFDHIKGLKNLIVIKGTGDRAKFADVVIVETSGEANIIANAKTTKEPTVTFDKFDALNLTAVTSWTAGTPATVSAADWVTGTADGVKFTVTAAAGSSVKATVNGTAYNSGDEIVVSKGATELVLKVVVSELYKADETYTYTVNLTVA